MSNAGSIDFEAWSPQLRVARFAGVPAEERVQEYLDWMTSALKASRGVLFILDATNSSLTHPAFVRRQATWIKTHRPLIAERSFGTSLVMNGAVLRFTLSSILLVAPSPVTMAVHGTFDEGLRWAGAELSKRGFSMPQAPLGSQSRSA